MSNPRRIQLAASFILTILLMSLLAKRGDLIHEGDMLILTGGLLLTVSVQEAIRRRNPLSAPPAPAANLTGFWMVIFLMMYMSTGAAENSWFFFPKWSISHKGVLPSWLFRSLGLTFLFSLFVKKYPQLISKQLFVLLCAAVMVLCFVQLGRETGFQPIYRVDHSSFYYRFISFRETFPRPDFYDPNWNGGNPVPYLVASGTWSMALLWYPLLKLFSVDTLYTPMIAVTFLVLVPFSAYLATRLFGGGKRAAWITFLLFLIPGQRFFTHILHYGTSPSIFCLCLFPLILALIWKLFQTPSGKRLLPVCLALTAVSGITLCWPGSVLSGIPLVAAVISIAHLWSWKKLCALTGVALALILLLTPLALVPLRHSPIGEFLSHNDPKSVTEIFQNGVHLLSGLLQGIHPVIVITGSLSVLFDENRNRGRMMGSYILCGGLLAGWGEEFSPLLQWERLIIPSALVGAVGAGLGIDRYLEEFSTLPESLRKSLNRTGAAWILSLLLLGGYQGKNIYGNKGQMDFQTMPDHTRELVTWLKNGVPDGGRILIAGKAVHGYGGAKVAAMPLMTGKEMMACDFYGFSPKLVEYQYPPKVVREQGPDGVFRFLDLYNVTHVMTYHQNWKEAFERHPGRYRKEYENGRVQVYRVHRENSIFLEGGGSVEAGFERITLRPDPGLEQVVLKYNWSDHFKAEPPAEIFPVDREFGIRLIGIRPNGRRQIDLEYRP